MDQDFYIQLIHQSLRGELLGADEERLSEWRKATPENQLLEEQVRKGWELSQHYEPELTLDSAAAFNQLRTRVRAHEAEQNQDETPEEPPMAARVRQLPNPRWKGLSIAAAIALLFVAAFLLWPSEQTSELIIAAATDEPKDVFLPDGSTVTLRENSQLEYPATFPVNQRDVRLSGEAFFQVTPDANAPFTVDAGNQVSVRVLGTSFLVKASDPTTEVRVSVESGRVALLAPGGLDSLLLAKGKAGRFRPGSEPLRLTEFRPNDTAWKTGAMSFVNQPLSSVIADLSDQYGTTITLLNPDMADCRFTGRFPSFSLAEILDALKDNYGLEWQQKSTVYELSQGVCQ